MGNLTRITKFRHFSSLTTTASKSPPNPTFNHYRAVPKFCTNKDTDAKNDLLIAVGENPRSIDYDINGTSKIR